MDAEQFSALAGRVEAEIRKVIVGQQDLVRDVLSCLFAEGHVLLEGVPGLGKTVLLRTLGDVLALDISRVQCTPDLMPADITGTNVIVEGMRQEFQPGPVFTQLLLADEVNRTTPKTQSALLEAMAEQRVTVGGVTRVLPRPFFVMATQNPIDMEGTYPLPEAQLDRFMAKVLVPNPTADHLVEILARTTGTDVPAPTSVATVDELKAAIHMVREVPMASHVMRHVVDLVACSHAGGVSSAGAGSPDLVNRYVTTGASPRGGQALVMLAKVRALFDGRLQASIEDVRDVAHIALRHRLVLGYEALPAGVSTDDCVDALLEAVPAAKPPVKGAV